VPNARLARDFALLRLLETCGPREDVNTLRGRLDAASSAGEHPETLCDLGEQCGYTTRMEPGEKPDEFDVLFSLPEVA
jgi:hypothetical protein